MKVGGLEIPIRNVADTMEIILFSDWSDVREKFWIFAVLLGLLLHTWLWYRIAVTSEIPYVGGEWNIEIIERV
jgi:hypothetical protein